MAWTDDYCWTGLPAAKRVQGREHYSHRPDANVSRSDRGYVCSWCHSLWPHIRQGWTDKDNGARRYRRVRISGPVRLVFPVLSDIRFDPRTTLLLGIRNRSRDSQLRQRYFRQGATGIGKWALQCCAEHRNGHRQYSRWLCIGVRRTVDLLCGCRDPVPLNNNLILPVEKEVDHDLSADFERVRVLESSGTSLLETSSEPRIPGPLLPRRGSGTLVGSRPRLRATRSAGTLLQHSRTSLCRVLVGGSASDSVCRSLFHCRRDVFSLGPGISS